MGATFTSWVLFRNGSTWKICKVDLERLTVFFDIFCFKHKGIVYILAVYIFQNQLGVFSHSIPQIEKKTSAFEVLERNG